MPPGTTLSALLGRRLGCNIGRVAQASTPLRLAISVSWTYFIVCLQHNLLMLLQPDNVWVVQLLNLYTAFLPERHPRQVTTRMEYGVLLCRHTNWKANYYMYLTIWWYLYEKQPKSYKILSKFQILQNCSLACMLSKSKEKGIWIQYNNSQCLLESPEKSYAYSCW